MWTFEEWYAELDHATKGAMLNEHKTDREQGWWDFFHQEYDVYTQEWEEYQYRNYL